MTRVVASIADESLALMPQRAVYWERRRTLFVADLHVGKAAAFRAGGVPIPRGTTGADLERLSNALSQTGAERLVVLGDLYHAKEGMADETLAQLASWREAHSELAVDIVRGNHDRRSGPSPRHLHFTEHDTPLVDAPFVLRHDPIPDNAGYVLAGHVHPAAKLRSRGVRAIRLPCYYFGAAVGILPAFGVFTGSATIRPRPGERVYVVTGDEVVNATTFFR